VRHLLRGFDEPVFVASLQVVKNARALPVRPEMNICRFPSHRGEQRSTIAAAGKILQFDAPTIGRHASDNPRFDQSQGGVGDPHGILDGAGVLQARACGVVTP